MIFYETFDLALCYVLIAPSAPPQNISVDVIKTHNTLTLRWLMPPSDKIHGDLTGYKIMYTMRNRGTTLITDASTDHVVVHPSFTEYTLSSLSPNTKYEIDILAMNEVGDGVSATVQACKFLYWIPTILLSNNSQFLYILLICSYVLVQNVC